MKFGFCTNIDNYQLLADLGYDYIELSGREILTYSPEKMKEVLKILSDGPVSCCGFNSTIPVEVPIVGEGFSPEKTSECAKKLCFAAAFLGASNIGIGSPASRRLPKGYDMARADDEARQFLTIFSQEASQYRINILWEHLNYEESNYCITWKDGLNLVHSLNLPNVSLVCDLYHIHTNGESLLDLSLDPSAIGHVHMAQKSDGLRVALLPEYKDIYKEFLFTLMGLGYDGTVSVEPINGQASDQAELSLNIMKEIISQWKKQL